MDNLLSHNDGDNNYINISEIETFKDVIFAFEKSMNCNKYNTYLKFDKNAKIAELY